jgi:hypothetical protein
MANPTQLKRVRLGGNDSAIKGRVGDVFDAFVFEPELKPLGSSEWSPLDAVRRRRAKQGQHPENWAVRVNQTGGAERPTELGRRRSQDVEIELAVTDAKQRPGFPSPASPVAASRGRA